MNHVFAILGLAVAIVVWFLLQRATGRRAGGCGACGCGGGGSGSCAKDRPEGDAPAAQAGVPADPGHAPH